MFDFGLLVDRLKRQSPEEFRQTLIRAGVLDEDLELADHYCTEKQKREKRNRKKFKAGAKMYAVKVNGKYVRFDGSKVTSVEAPEKGTLYSRLADAQYRMKGIKNRRSNYGVWLDNEWIKEVDAQIFEVEFNHTAKWVDG